MAHAGIAPPVTLIPARTQALWGWPAVANFGLGGVGAGFYVAAALAARLDASPALALATWLGPALVAAGFASVAGEAGRPLRGPRVLAGIGTSWMSRELWLGAAFVLVAAAGLVAPAPAQRLAAAALGCALALAQGLILREARGVAAWAVPVMPILFLSSALVSGLGLLALTGATLGAGPGPRLLGAALAVLTVHVVVWWSFVTWSGDPAFRHAVNPLCKGRGSLLIMGGGYVVPSFLLALGVAVPELARAFGALGGALLVLSQLHVKAALILQAGQLRPITLPHLSLQRRA